MAEVMKCPQETIYDFTSPIIKMGNNSQLPFVIFWSKGRKIRMSNEYSKFSAKKLLTCEKCQPSSIGGFRVNIRLYNCNTEEGYYVD